ncbi:hypothetical protein AYO21_01119 [Fonsecaea monophora]|uniref:NADH:flavin oxidoreductase/NADH oxidase N-terminal domain-containing protein n=1 Tax=Fonsecaea monophora TaxID=254056 RepID=A0A177FN87_9EURO|nr:hypothetical protein AYO21_01119 [Fonsecaea monophora]KAH0841647.1 12-oxophytodienoate reductase 1 [Fonsecaea pedrosoi]OAG44629.1 hypothetical protein AYO21_01119 [Fonsecaea monophora]
MEQLITPIKHLKQPLQIGPLKLRNRFAMSSISRNRSDNTYPNELNGEYFYQRALGGAGLIVAGGALIEPQGTPMRETPQIDTHEHMLAWKKVVDKVHTVPGSVFFCQLWHCGRMTYADAKIQKDYGRPTIAPSAIQARMGVAPDNDGVYDLEPGLEKGYSTPTAIEDPKAVVEQFRRSAIFAKAAGFDGVELHGANGYLVAQFLDDGANIRTDAYGGSVENRARFCLECIDALIDVWGPYRVGIKLSPAVGRGDLGMFPVERQIEQFTYLIKELDKRPLAYINLVRYLEFMDMEVDGKMRGPKHPVWATYRHLIKNAKVFLNGAISLVEAEELLKDDTGDVIVFGRPWLVNPDFANAAMAGKEKEITFDFNFDYFAQYPPGNPAKGYIDYPFLTTDYKAPQLAAKI